MRGVESESLCSARAPVAAVECPLRRSFLHLPRIGLRTERRLWREGIRTWDDLEAARREPPDLFDERSSPLLDAIDDSRNALDAGDAAFFAERLPPGEHYRIAASFPRQTVFLDIETTGLSLYYGHHNLDRLRQGRAVRMPRHGNGGRLQQCRDRPHRRGKVRRYVQRHGLRPEVPGEIPPEPPSPGGRT